MAKGTRPFAVFDIDGTLIRWQLYHAITDALVKFGFIDASEYASVKEARMQWKMRQASFKDYEQKVVDLSKQAITGLSTDQFEQAAQAVFDEYKDQVYTYTRELIKELKADGYLIFAISGSQAEIVEKMAKHYGFDDFIASKFEVVDGKFSGRVVSYIGRKDEALTELVKRNKATLEGSIAVGDSLSDVQMLKLVERPIAFNPEKELFEHAKINGWQVVIERKNMVYELERQNGKYQLVKTN